MRWNWCDSGCSAPVVWRENGVALCAHCYVELIETEFALSKSGEAQPGERE